MSVPSHPAVDRSRLLLRHTLATIAYRGAKAIRDAPRGYPDYRPAESIRSPAEILAHIGDLFEWAEALARGTKVVIDQNPRTWEEEVQRFHHWLGRFDEYLASNEPLFLSADRLLQGPLADALTHVGQLAMLRRMAGAPIAGENYAAARIEPGRLGRDQEPPVNAPVR